MKTLIAVVLLAALSGCVVAPPAAPVYATPVAQKPYNPYEWHVVSSEPVQSAASGPSRTVYTSEPITYAQPVYVPQPYYFAPQPYYFAPPFTIGLDFVFGGFWGGRHGGHRGGWGVRGHGRR